MALRNVLSFLRAYRRHLIIGPAFKLIEAILELLLPLVVARMIDRGIRLADKGLILQDGLLGVLLAIIGLGCALVCQYTASLASQGYGTDLRRTLFARILHLPQAAVEQFGSVSLTNRLTSDTVTLQQAVAMLIRLVVRAPFLTVGGVVMAWLIDWQLALIFVLVLPLFVLVLYSVISRSIPLVRLIQQKLDQMVQVLLESLDGSRVIRAFGREKDHQARFAASNDAVADAAWQAGRMSAWLNPVTTLILNGAIVAILWLGGWRIGIGRLSQGELIAFINYLGQILAALMVVANLVVLYTRAYAAGRRVEAVLTAPILQDDLAAPIIKDEPVTPLHQDEPAAPIRQDDLAARVRQIDGASARLAADRSKWSSGLAFQDVCFTYPTASAPLFQGLSFTIAPGATLGVIGPTGSGKSTLVALLLRQHEISAGAISFAGRSIADQARADWLARVAVVPQKSVLLTGSLADNLRLGQPLAAEDDLWWALTVAQAADFVRALPKGLATPVAQGGRNFSGGQRQRLAIARALLVRPALLILDDSTSALDYATDAALRRALADEPRLAGLTCLIISQRVAAIRQADRILVLDDGQAVGFGSHQELLATNDTYQEICQSQLTHPESVT